MYHTCTIPVYIICIYGGGTLTPNGSLLPLPELRQTKIAWLGWAHSGPAPLGWARPGLGSARPNLARLDAAWLGLARLRLGSARPGPARPRSAQLGSTRVGSGHARPGPALAQAAFFLPKLRLGFFSRYCSTSAAESHISEKLRQKQKCSAQLGSARPGLAPLGSASVQLSSTRPSLARLGSTWTRIRSDSARIGLALVSSAWHAFAHLGPGPVRP